MSALSLATRPGAVSDVASPDLTIRNPDAGWPGRLSHLRGTPVVLSFLPVEWDLSLPANISLFNRLHARFLGPGQPLIEAAIQGVWCRLGFADRGFRVALVSPRNLTVENPPRSSTGTGAVFLIDGLGVVRWRFFPPSGGTVPADEILSALSDLAPVAGPPGGLSREEFAAATLAATLILSTRPNGRASYLGVLPAMNHR
jgi:hypothetical protein